MLSAMPDQVPQGEGPGFPGSDPGGASGRPLKPDRLAHRRRYIIDLLRRQHAMELGGASMQPMDYRALSKRLRQALAGLPEDVARNGFADLPLDLLPLASEMLETRHFERNGELFGLRAALCRDEATALLQRLRQPPEDD